MAPGRVRKGEARSTDKTTTVAWIPPENLDVREWVLAGKRLGAMTRCSQWWLGDWLRYGTVRWGEKYREAARITGYDVKTLRNIAYVSGQVDVSRRRDKLTWSHHAEVCSLEPEQQDRWLNFAEREGVSVADLRIEIRSTMRAEDGESPGSKPNQKKMVTCPQCEHQFETPAS
ncbi:MAG: LmbU family transcriptional regulator [Solirubrobacterales bacterium]